MKNTTILAFAFTLAVSACGHKEQTVNDVPPKVDVTTPRVDSITLTADYPGVLSANRKVNVVAKVNGQILSKNFEGGTPVKQGQVLFTIDPSVYRDRVNQAKAALTTSRSALDYAQVHYDAILKAAQSDAVSKMEIEQARNALIQAEASVENNKAALESATRLLSYCTVTAPISGVVEDNLLSVGSYVTGEGAPVTLTTIYDNSIVTATFSIEDARYQQLLNIRETADSLVLRSVPLKFEQNLPHSYTGDLYYMAPALNNSTGTLMLKCKIQNPYSELKPGMYVKISLPYEQLTDAILVNDASIGSDQQGNYLYTVNDSNRVARTSVMLGELYQDSLRVVTSGLKPSDRYVTKALLKVRAGMIVEPHYVD